jgi:NTP pyrophosphatase (non-canonical NTP hydrolase)
MTEMQKEVDAFIGQFNTGYFSPLANLARLTEEVGELSREINHLYGEKKKKDSEDENTIKAELGDNLFVLLCIANSLDIDMTESLMKRWINTTNAIKIVTTDRKGVSS